MKLPGLSARLPDNECRFRGQPGHVESYFLRANDPDGPRALWIKATILSPLAGDPVAESWFIWFDGNRTFAHRDTFPFRDASFLTTADGTDVAVGPLRLSLRDEGAASGQVDAPEGRASFELGFQRGVTRVARPLSCYPFGFLQDGPFPKSKFNTPFPFLRLTGQVTVQGQTVSLDGWTAAQGHNWGHEHHHDYAWAQCLFPVSGTEPEAMVEGGSGRLQLAGRMTPLLSVLVVRRGDAEYRFDSLVDLWRQEPRISRGRFTLRMRSRTAEARLRVDASERPMACLGYPNPDGALAYCLNTKLAEVLLEVHPRGEAPFTHRSAHGGALEFLTRQLPPGAVVI